jgi:hypothetical protein
MTRAILSVLAFVVISGCVTRPPPSVQELTESLNKSRAESSRIFPGKTEDQVRSASQKVLYLLDPSDMGFDLVDHQVLATRAGIIITFGAVFNERDWYSVSTSSVPGGVRSTLGLSSETNLAFVAGGQIPYSFKESIPATANNNWVDYKLFHDRVEYILGMRPQWPTCDEAKKESPDKPMLLCDSIGLENNSPESLSAKD